MKSKLFPAYLKIKPFLYAIAILCVAITIYNQYLNHRLKLRNPDPWIVIDVISGDRFLVERNGEELEVQLCGISASEGSQEYLRSRRDPLRGSLLNKGDGSVILDKVSKQKKTSIAEVFVQLRSC